MPSWPARPPPSPSSRPAGGRCCRSPSRSCASSLPREDAVARPAHRLGVRRRPVRRRPQLDRDRLHLPGGMPAWLGWVAVVLLSLYLAIYPALAAGLAWRFGRDNRVALVLVLGGAWAITEWLRGTMFTGFPWNPAAAALAPTPLITITRADRHLRPVRPGRPARRRGLARILPQVAAAGDHPRRRPPCCGCCRPSPVPDDPLTVTQRPHRPAEHRPGGQMAAGLRRRGRAAACAAVRAARRRSRGCCCGPKPRSPSRSRTPAAGEHQAFAEFAAHARGLAARPRRPSADRRHRRRFDATASHVDGAANSIFVLAPGGKHRRPLRQGASRPLWRISADAAAAVGDRPVAARAGRRRLRRRARVRARSISAANGARSASSSATRSSSPAMSSTGAIARASSSTPPTTPGSAAGDRRSISPRRGCARPRKAFRSFARRRPGISAVIDARGNVVKSLPGERRRDRRRNSARRNSPPPFARFGNLIPIAAWLRADHRRHCAWPPPPLEAPYKDFLISQIRRTRLRSCAALTCSRPNPFPKATRQGRRPDLRRHRRPVPVQGPGGARRLRDHDDDQPRRPRRRNPRRRASWTRTAIGRPASARRSSRPSARS